MGYMDTVEKWHREQHPDPRVEQWQQQEHIEDRARALVAESLKEGKYLDCRPTSAEMAAIDEAYKLSGGKPDWPSIMRAANERANRARAKEFAEVAERVRRAALAEGD